MSVKKHRYAATASTVYFSYFMMGIGMSLLAQFKPQFASLWHSSISGVLSVVSAVGIGGIVSILITGPISDHFGAGPQPSSATYCGLSTISACFMPRILRLPTSSGSWAGSPIPS